MVEMNPLNGAKDLIMQISYLYSLEKTKIRWDYILKKKPTVEMMMKYIKWLWSNSPYFLYELFKKGEVKIRFWKIIQ